MPEYLTARLRAEGQDIFSDPIGLDRQTWYDGQ